MNKEEIEKRLLKLGKWLHPIDLGYGIITQPFKGIFIRPQSEQTRVIRKGINYEDKLVLDLGCAEGMWAFEAEKLGARKVVAIDVSPPGYSERALFAREVLNSSVMFYFSVSIQNLFVQLDTFFNYYSKGEKFDIVQHLGLFYHLRDPLHSLSQVRKCIKPDGTLLFETAIYLTDLKEPICLFNWNNRIYNDGSTWWAPNLLCLLAMLRLSLFEPDENSIRISHKNNPKSIGRVSLIAKAVGGETVSRQVALQLRQDRHIGLDVVKRNE